MVSPHSPTAAPAPARSHRTPTLVIAVLIAAVVAGIIGLGAGGLGGYLFGSSDGPSDAGSRAEQNVQEGCAILERLEEDLPAEADALDLSSPLIFELTAAGSSFMAAGRADQSLETMSEAGNDLVSGANTLNTDRINESIETLQSECAAR